MTKICMQIFQALQIKNKVKEAHKSLKKNCKILNLNCSKLLNLGVIQVYFFEEGKNMGIITRCKSFL